jgi:hypothetical protein
MVHSKVWGLILSCVLVDFHQILIGPLGLPDLFFQGGLNT